MFPPGLPGLALLALRASVAIALLLETYGNGYELSDWIPIAAILISICLSAGFLTPIVAAMALVSHGLIWLGLGFESATVAIVFSLDALALVLLGPGAYSFDSFRFGRRVVVLPPL